MAVNAAVWLVLGPVIARGLHRRTVRSVDALLDNMAAAGEPVPASPGA